ncbi:MAG: hypothetical protein NZ926_00340 [Candidatus Methanomethylicia archaeon]|nr:hypothetical protein [Candidatus Methanomethylicia archaeon]MCX8168884.1 hypothetical protein [Candidatus Methanomethylicia archaeon]MDW7988616.1 hypothetical protein [Nitrososphaerota archaeon]
MGRIDKGVNCSITGCSSHAIRSLSYFEISKAILDAGLNVDSKVSRRVYLCENHYKIIKKFLKKEKMYERWRYS